MDDDGITLQEESIIQKVKSYQKMTIAPKNIAKILKIQVEDVCKIIGFDIETMDEQHREYCFNNHGIKDKAIELRMEGYGVYLNEGDFEKFQPMCYLDKHSPEFLKLHEQVKLIQISDDPVKEARRLWILNRFTNYQSDEWKKLRDQQHETILKIPDLNFLHPYIKRMNLERKNMDKFFE